MNRRPCRREKVLRTPRVLCVRAGLPTSSEFEVRLIVQWYPTFFITSLSCAFFNDRFQCTSLGGFHPRCALKTYLSGKGIFRSPTIVCRRGYATLRVISMRRSAHFLVFITSSIQSRSSSRAPTGSGCKFPHFQRLFHPDLINDNEPSDRCETPQPLRPHGVVVCVCFFPPNDKRRSEFTITSQRVIYRQSIL